MVDEENSEAPKGAPEGAPKGAAAESPDAEGADGANLALNDFEPQENGGANGRRGEQNLQKNEMHTAEELEAVYDIPVQVSAVLGRSAMQVSQLLKLGRGAVVELDRKVGEPVDILVNNRLVARGEVVVVDERLGGTMTEIIKSDRN